MKTILVIAFFTAIVTTAACGVFLFGAGLGIDFGRQLTRQEAVDNGAGKWTIDQQTGQKGFEWTPKGGTP